MQQWKYFLAKMIDPLTDQHYYVVSMAKNYQVHMMNSEAVDHFLIISN